MAALTRLVIHASLAHLTSCDGACVQVQILQTMLKFDPNKRSVGGRDSLSDICVFGEAARIECRQSFYVSIPPLIFFAHAQASDTPLQFLRTPTLTHVRFRPFFVQRESVRAAHSPLFQGRRVRESNGKRLLLCCVSSMLFVCPLLQNNH